MFNITKLSTGSQQFMTQVIGSGRSRSKVAAIALARMIASGYTMPSAPVNDVEAEYRMHSQINTMTKVSTINELIPVDTDYVMELARSFFKLRYANAHPNNFVFSFREGSYLEDFFDITRSFDEDTLKIIATEGKDLAFFANGFRNIISDIDTEESKRVEAEVSGF